MSGLQTPMKKFLHLLLIPILLAQLLVSAVPPVTLLKANIRPVPMMAESRLDQLHSASHWVRVFADDGNEYGCSATAIGKHSLLTATHCDLGTHIRVDEKWEETVIGKVSDGLDHTIWLLSGKGFKAIYPLEVAQPHQAEHVIMFSNPNAVKDQYSEGYINGRIPDIPTPAELDANKPGKHILWAMTLTGNHGSSGAAIVDASTGAIVSICTYGLEDAVASGVMGGFALQFTPGQLAVVHYFNLHRG